MSQANQPATPSAELAEWMESLQDEQSWPPVVADIRQRDWWRAFTRTVVEPVDPDSVELDPLTVL